MLAPSSGQELAVRLALVLYIGYNAVATVAGISEQAWWSAERGENMPGAEAAVAIARVLGVTVEQLDFRRVDSSEPSGD